MCQKRRGWPRSTIRKTALKMMSGKARKWPTRTAARSLLSPNRSSQAAAKYTPPVTPPTKKYSTIQKPQAGGAKEGLKSGGIWRIHPAFAEGQHAGDTRQNGGDESQTAAHGQVATGQLWRLGETESRRCVLDQIER